jgi:4-amino-4-deoxy-L-arabinose transferase-like glycosyltransferase
MVRFRLQQNPYLLFSPFLLLFIILVFRFYNPAMEGDEGQYISLAQNLLKGFYSPPSPDINLWNGPGYPIILMPFIAMRLPLISITLMNAIFQYLSIVLLFKTLIQFVSFRKAIFFSFFWAFCYSSYPFMYKILTETFTIFLISLLIFLLVNAFNSQNKKYIYLSGFIIGYLTLTKIIFGYVLLILFIGSVLLWIRNRKLMNYRRSALIMIIALATTVPYLLYTYNLTERLFYWGNSGGMSLYWMSTPFENEYGDWNNETFTANLDDADIAGSTTHLKINHLKDIDEVSKYTGVEKDDAYKRLALENIKTHPKKYFKNIISNISRAVFGFPGSYTYQRPLLKIWYSSILFSLIIFNLLPTFLNWKRVTYSIRFLFVFVFLYLGISSLVSIGNRQFVVVIPLLLIWIAIISQKSISIRLKFDSQD